MSTWSVTGLQGFDSAGKPFILVEDYRWLYIGLPTLRMFAISETC